MESRLMFDSQGKLSGVDGLVLEDDEDSETESLTRSKEVVWEKKTDLNDSDYWSLYRDGKKLEPLKFSNGKTQENVVKEVVDLIKGGEKVVFLHGMCGTGKSSIALNIARCLGRAAVVVPVKNLQRQYEEDYMGNMKVFKRGGEQLKISLITGRNNHDSIYNPGVSCADPFLPDTIQITEKNFNRLKEYYLENPLIGNTDIDDIKRLRRISVAPANPYWSPIIPAEYDVQLKDAVKKRYTGLRNREFVFYHRKKGCSYYDQYQAYFDSDVIIYNAAKYKIEVALDRKPQTEVDIIDEADEFLDSFSNQMELNLTRLSYALKRIVPENSEVYSTLDDIQELVSLEEKRVGAVGINEDEIFSLKDTKVGKILSLFLKDRNVESEISMDDLNYANTAVEVAKNFIDFLDDTYLTYRKYEDNLVINLVTTNLSKRLKEVLDKNKTFVFMSGTLHSERVLKKIFGLEKFKIVEAETVEQGEIEIFRTGRERDCSYRSFKDGGLTRGDYLRSLKSCISRGEKPMLIHVQAFDDLPSNDELVKYELGGIMSKDRLYELQISDKTGRAVSMFKQGLNDELYSTKCTRGVDFPGDVCKSVVFTKYPNPNVRGSFWKILQKTHSEYYWEFYRDKARREFLQRIYRALRSRDDHVFVLSPDLRVLNAVRELQVNGASQK